MAHDGDVKLEHRLEDFAVEQTCRDCLATIDLVRTIMDPATGRTVRICSNAPIAAIALGTIRRSRPLRRPGN